jgi:hypothetical protein
LPLDFASLRALSDRELEFHLFGLKLMTLAADEYIPRFLLHTLPDGSIASAMQTASDVNAFSRPSPRSSNAVK